MVSKRPFLQKRKKNKKIGLKLTFRMVSKKPFLQKRKEKRSKLTFRMVSKKLFLRKKKKIGSKFTFRMVSKKLFLQKRKEKEENRLKTYLSNGPISRFYNKKKRKKSV